MSTDIGTKRYCYQFETSALSEKWHRLVSTAKYRWTFSYSFLTASFIFMGRTFFFLQLVNFYFYFYWSSNSIYIISRYLFLFSYFAYKKIIYFTSLLNWEKSQFPLGSLGTNISRAQVRQTCLPEIIQFMYHYFYYYYCFLLFTLPYRLVLLYFTFSESNV